MDKGYVKSWTRDVVRVIEFHHPQSNSLPGKLLKDLAREIHDAGSNDECKIILIRSGEGRAFCAGASFTELQSVSTEEEGKKFFMGFANVINAMRKCPKFIIGRIHGKCVGGGVGLACAMDYCIATERAEVRLSELAIGLGPFVVGPVVERKIGKAAYMNLSIDAQMWRSAQWAHEKGMFAEIYETEAGMDEALLRLLHHLKEASPFAMKGMKKVFWADAENWDILLEERATISGKLLMTDIAKQAIQLLKSKR
jgi:methylglutaconyl-CoA hydratase